MATIKKAQNGVSKSKSELDFDNKLKKAASKESKYNKVKEKTGEIRTEREYMQPTLATMGYLNKTKSTKKPDKVLAALAKDKNGGSVKKAKDGMWMQKAAASIKKRGTAGKCTPITKPGCTGKAKALAKTFKKIAKKNKK